MQAIHKILIVDDEPNILKSLKRVLHGENREVFIAEDAEKGMEILDENKDIEVIISDNRLPAMSGIEFLTKIRSKYPDTIRILITGYPDLSTAMDAINKASIWRYMLKPIEIDELKILVNQAFEYHKILRENRLLLQIARQQAEWLKVLQERYPEIVDKEVDESSMYIIEEKRVSEIVAQFLNKYYPKNKNE